MSGANPILVEVRRGDVVESVHRGTVLATGRDGAILLERGDINRTFFPRSAVKPLQAAALMRAGLTVGQRELAVACASHSGESKHLEAVQAILSGNGLKESDLQNTPSLPYGDEALLTWVRDGGKAASLVQNCSGKHAAMLATCKVNGWSTADYLDPEHPVQVAIRMVIEDLCGEEVAEVTTDGCGAPLFALTFRGVARAFQRLVDAAAGTAERSVADAMRAHPDLVAGTGRADTTLMRSVHGLVAKIGAEGVFAVAAPGAPAIVVKLDDGASRASSLVAAKALIACGVVGKELDEQSRLPVLGHGEPVGEIVVCGL